MEMLLEHEGGYVNGNRIGDPGGITNMGVTKRTYDEYHGVDMDREDEEPYRRGRHPNLQRLLMVSLLLRKTA